MSTEFEEVFSPGEPDAVVPESTGSFSKAQLEAEAELAVEEAIPARVPPSKDRYATRRGPNHWTRRRPSQGPTRKLSDEDAAFARRTYPAVRVVVIAATLHVTPSTIYGVLNGKTHRRASAGWRRPESEDVA